MRVDPQTLSLWPGEPPVPGTFAEAAELLGPGSVARHDAALLALPGFASRYHARGPLAPAPSEEPGAGALGRVLRDFLAWYGLEAGFFPRSGDALAAMGPTDFAAHMLGVYHDVFHALTGHNTSDEDEVAIQSFLFGQAPVAFARFIAEVRGAPDLTSAPRYKHLRDLLACPLDPAALARGRAAAPLLDLDYEAAWSVPVEALRARLGIEAAPRPRTRSGRNSCGGRDDAHFFA